MTDASLPAELRARRLALGLTQAELAERAGISERAVSDIERGLRRKVYRDTAQRIARALELKGAEAAAFEAVARGAQPAAADVPFLAAPVPRTPIFGRSHELEELAALLRSTEARLVTVTGPGGAGKTRVTLEVARVLADEFDDGVAFVPLGDVTRPDLALAALASTLRVGGGGDVAESIAARLRGRRLLVILDTFEHVLPVAAALAGVVAGSAPARFLVTSRVPLNIRAERLLALGPLDEASAVAMFASCVTAQKPSTGEPTDEAVVANICRRVDGLPLAIELAAARTRALAPRDILLHLGRRLPLLADGPVDLPERQRSMEATIAWSYELLASDDRRLLEQLSVFAGGWTLAAAEAVCEVAGDLLAGLGRLVDSSLVQADAGRSGGTRYRMLDTVREYAAARLSHRRGSAGGPELARKHAEFFRALAAAAEPGLRAAGHEDSVERLAAEVDNLRSALAWSVEADESEAALALAGSLWMFWRLTGAFAEGRAWLSQVLAMPAANSTESRAAALWGAGWLALHQGDLAETAARGAELVAWAEGAGDATALRNGVTLLGEERLAAADYAEAGRHFDRALELARSTGQTWLIATSCLNRSGAALHAGDLDLAGSLHEQAEALYRQLGDDRFLAKTWLQQAYAALLRGDVTAARALVQSGLETARVLGDVWGSAEQLDGLAAVLAAEGDAVGAARMAGLAEATWDRIGASSSPADRRSTDRWLKPALASLGGTDAVAAVAEGRALELEATLTDLVGGGAGKGR